MNIRIITVFLTFLLSLTACGGGSSNSAGGTIPPPDPYAVLKLPGWEDTLKACTVFPKNSEAYRGIAFEKNLEEMKKDRGCVAIGLVMTKFQDTRESHEFYDGWITVTDEVLEEGIKLVHKKGMSVTLLTHLNIRDRVTNLSVWRAELAPANLDQWFVNYRDFIVKYAKIAQKHGVAIFSVGTEMHGVTSTEGSLAKNASGPGKIRWPQIMEQTDQVYRGLIGYSAQHTGRSILEQENELLRSKYLDFIGISAYFGMDGARTLDELTARWDFIEQKYIVPVWEKYGKPIGFLEGGYRPCAFALDQPWDSWTVCPYDGETQRLGYEAWFKFMSRAHEWPFFGVATWADEPDGAGGAGNTQYTIKGKSAEEVVELHWRTTASKEVVVEIVTANPLSRVIVPCVENILEGCFKTEGTFRTK